MVFRFAVTGSALGGRAFEDPVLVAVLALDGEMRAGEREAAQVVVEGGVFPVGGGVTGFAGCAILAVVGVIGLVTGVAIFGRAFVLAVLMATLALGSGVFAFQFEGGAVVVKLGGLPAFGGVTHAAVCPKLSGVGVIF